jgi:type III secretion protein Q
MQDAATLVDRTTSASPRPAPRPAQRLTFTPVHKLTRAHLALAERPGAVAELRGVAEQLAAHLSGQLGAPVTLRARLTDASLHPFSHLARQAVFALIELGGDATGVLELDAVAVGALLQQVTGAKPAQPAPLSLTRIEEAAVGWLLLSSLSALRRHDTIATRYAPRLLSFHVERGPVLELLDARRRHVGIELQLTIAEQHGHARLLLPALWLQAVVSALPEEPAGALTPEVGAATLDAQCCLGRTELPAAEASALERGDVVLLQGVSRVDGRLLGPLRLATSTFELFGDVTADGFTFTRATTRSPLETRMSTLDPSLSIDVEIELARLRLPISQLSTLRPGGVLPLHVNAAQTVIVRVGDKPVAKAELVEIEGDLGARILSLL